MGVRRGAGYGIVSHRPSGQRHLPHNALPGSLGERDAVCSPGFEAGRRRAIGVVAALPINHLRDHADGATLVRWDNVTADQKAGDEDVRVHDYTANLKIVMTLRAMIHRAATPTRNGWVAGAEAPAYSSEKTIALLGPDRIPAKPADLGYR